MIEDRVIEKMVKYLADKNIEAIPNYKIEDEEVDLYIPSKNAVLLLWGGTYCPLKIDIVKMRSRLKAKGYIVLTTNVNSIIKNNYTVFGCMIKNKGTFKKENYETYY